MRRDFTLLEMVLALAIFAITVVGLVQGMNLTIRSAAYVATAGHVRQQLESRLVEARLRPLAAVTVASAPDAQGVVYTTFAEPARLADRHGKPLAGLYRLRLTAQWTGPEGPQSESVEEYVWQPTTP